MKTLSLLAVVVVTSFTMNAQVTIPQASPSAHLEQKVGLTDVSVDYSRPGVKGRTIFGDLVPFQKLWRTGANENTKITFSEDVKIGGKALKKGSYAIYTKPSQQSWEVIFYTDTDNWGVPRNWDESKVAASITAKANAVSNVESFTIGINNLSNNGATLEISWEKTMVAVSFSVPTESKVIASIEKAMKGPSAGDYYQSAIYYHQQGKDINKAKAWIDKAIEVRGADNPAFWYHRQQSLIYADSGDKKGAIKAAKRSLELAKKAENNDYISLNKKSLKEWGAL